MSLPDDFDATPRDYEEPGLRLDSDAYPREESSAVLVALTVFSILGGMVGSLITWLIMSGSC